MLCDGCLKKSVCRHSDKCRTLENDIKAMQRHGDMFSAKLYCNEYMEYEVTKKDTDINERLAKTVCDALFGEEIPFTENNKRWYS